MGCLFLQVSEKSSFFTSPPETHDENSPMKHWSCFINWLHILTASSWWVWLLERPCCGYWRTSRWSPSVFPPFLCKLLCSYEHQGILLKICSHSIKSCTFWKKNKSRWNYWQSMEIRRSIVTLWTTEIQINGSMFNLQIRSTIGSISSELLGHMIKYARYHAQSMARNIILLTYKYGQSQTYCHEWKDELIKLNLRHSRQPQSSNLANKSHRTIKRTRWK